MADVATNGEKKGFRWAWLIWEVLIPLFGPILFSLVIVGLWVSLNDKFEAKFNILFGGLTPWALAFYGILLIASHLRKLLPMFGNHKTVGVALISIGLVISVFVALMVIWRHESNDAAGAKAYVVMVLLLISAVITCYISASKTDPKG